jgi:predicted Zn-dependent protease
MIPGEISHTHGRRHLASNIPSYRARVASGRPVLTKEQISALCSRLMGMTSSDAARLTVTHTARVVTRLANGQVLSGDDGDTLTIRVGMSYGAADIGMSVETNQLDDTVLHAIVGQCERLAREAVGAAQDNVRPRPTNAPDSIVPVHLWHEETIRAMTTARSSVLPALFAPVRRTALNAAGFVGLMARAEVYLDREDHLAYSEETDCEVTVSARTPDGKSSGWGGQAARNWATIDAGAIAAHAVRMATLCGPPVAVEPGRRTAILSGFAVAQLMRVLEWEYDAASTDSGQTGFSRKPRGNKRGERVFDARIGMRSDPADPDGGYRPYMYGNYGTPAMTWVDNGVLENLAYSPQYALAHGIPYVDRPKSLRVNGGPTSIEQMISQCEEGIYVNRVSSVHREDLKTGLTTGVTRDGCFLVKHGKIEKAVKNFRFLESPFFFLNRLKALGPSSRAPLGYVPPRDEHDTWPLLPMIVPPMMVDDFNFSALIDAV